MAYPQPTQYERVPLTQNWSDKGQTYAHDGLAEKGEDPSEPPKLDEKWVHFLAYAFTFGAHQFDVL